MQKFAEMNVAKLASAAAVVVIGGGVGMLLPSPSASAPAQPSFSPTAASVGLASDSHNARPTVTENGIGSRSWHGGRPAGRGTAPASGRCRSTSPSWARRTQRRSSTGRAIRAATTPIRVLVC